MIHDPCNPLPEPNIPQGLHLQPRRPARPVPGHAKLVVSQSHAITTMAPSYIGCDHTDPGHTSWPMKSVQFPPLVSLPPVTLLPSSAIVVATMPSYYPPLASFAGVPGGSDGETQLPMPEPASAAMFLFAILIVWSARRFDPRGWAFPSRLWPSLAAPPKRGHRHRNRSVAQYYAIQMPAR